MAASETRATLPAALPAGWAIGLAGPTAAGKTAAALAIAERWPVEIISVDSALVYRGMDIGTAKPSRAEQAAVPHHLIDILDPADAYSAADFVRDTRRLVAAIAQRGRLPLLVGGTMLYFKTLQEGLSDMPAADPAVRAALDEEARVQGWPALHAQLAEVDPATAARLAPGDSQRIQRALEVYRISGRTMTELHARAKAALPQTQAPLPLISLEPQDRHWLHTRIAQRFDQMLDGGLMDEVQALRARGDLHPGLPSMRCVGYRQCWEAMDGLWPQAELRDRGIQATRQLAKRQITWLRSMPQRTTIACDTPQATAGVLDALARLLQEAAP